VFKNVTATHITPNRKKRREKFGILREKPSLSTNIHPYHNGWMAFTLMLQCRFIYNATHGQLLKVRHLLFSAAEDHDLLTLLGTEHQPEKCALVTNNALRIRMLTAELFDQRNPKLSVVLELFEFLRIKNVSEMAGNHETLPVLA
jgi:hypothetical protein